MDEMGKNYAVVEANTKCMLAIEEALLSLLETKSYGDISISEITQKAGVSRNAYYRNFKSKDEIITNYLDNLAYAFLASAERVHTKDYYVKLFSAFKEHSTELCRLFNSGLVYLIFGVFLKYSKPKNGSGGQAALKDTYAAGGLFFIVMRWFDSGMKASPEEMADTLAAIRKNIR